MRFSPGSYLRTPLGRIAACVFAILVLFGATTLEAQFDNGQISGFVRDASGAVVPGVVVTATNEGNRQQREAVSNADGYYVFPSLIVAPTPYRQSCKASPARPRQVFASIPLRDSASISPWKWGRLQTVSKYRPMRMRWWRTPCWGGR